MTNHPHFAQICDLLNQGPELAVQVCLGVTSSPKQARRLFVTACMAGTQVTQHKEDWLEQQYLYGRRPWEIGKGIEAYWWFGTNRQRFNRVAVAHYAELFIKLTHQP